MKTITSIIILLLTSSLVPSPVEEPRFEDEYRLLLERSRERLDSIGTRSIERGWANTEFIPDTLPVVIRTGRTDRSFDEARFRQAVSHYEHAQELLRKFKSELNALQKKRLELRERLWWKEIDAISAINRQDRALRLKYERELALRFRFVFESLDSIAGTSLRAQPRFRNLQRTAYRMYAVHQTALGNFLPALDILTKYQKFPDAEKEWPLHYYLSICYAALFRHMLHTPGTPEFQLRKIRRKKNLHLLLAVELKFGPNSPQYQTVWSQVRLEELGPAASRR